ncbi:MAG TPA: hypothetical protein ENJ82_12660 [Bacteroidetes bacterium]|nr:hypothetical protein [Bacteroidota bacterium]
MKSIAFLFSLYALTFAFAQCGGSSPLKPSQFTPEGTLLIVFAAAQNGDYESLRNLCDPLHQNDGDTRSICNAGDKPAEFVAYFSKAELKGKATISGIKAEVPFLFGPNGTQTETMNMVKRGEKWYLISF